MTTTTGKTTGTTGNDNSTAPEPTIIDRTRDAASSAIETTREAATHALDTTRETAGHAYDATKKTALGAAGATVDGIESNPLAALIGGLAIGVTLGALLPKTQQEAKHLGPLGKRLTESAAAAARAARDAGRQELNAMMPDKGNAKEKVGSVLNTVVQAAKDSSKVA